MTKSTQYLLEFLFDGSEISSDQLEQEAIDAMEISLSDVELQIISTNPKFLKLSIKGSLENVDKYHDTISKKLCNQYPSIRLLDEASDEVRRRAYPIIAEIEQKLRTFINRAMTEVVGFNWWNLKTRPSDREEVKLVESSSGKITVFHHPLEFTQFTYLVKIVTDSPQEWSTEKQLSIADLMELFSDCDSIDKVQTKLHQKTQRSSLWDEVFSLYFDDSNQWESLKKQILGFVIPARHKVMHHRPIRLGELTGLSRIKVELDKLLAVAKTKLSTEDQSKAELAGKVIISQFKDSDFGKSIEETTEEAESWNELIDILLDTNSSDEDIADAAYRLSWYFLSVPSRLQDTVKNRLAQIKDIWLIRIIYVSHRLLKDNTEPMVELIVDLLRYIPNINVRIKHLIKEGKIPSDQTKIAYQIIKIIEQKFKPDLTSGIEN